MSEQITARPPRARRKAAEPAPSTLDAIEIALERVAKGEPADGPAHAVLRGHRDLLRWQTVSERMSVGLKVLTAVAGIALFAAAAGLVWNASRYQGLVVQAFAVPPDLAARGLTGEAVAGELLDRLVSMQEQTDSVRAPGSYAIDWGDSTEVEIPQTGVSIGELQRWLRSWLGKETRISGVVYRTRDGRLAVTARTGGSAGETFTGSEDELEALMQKAAESVYGRTQPYRYSAFLSGHDRYPEAEVIYRTADRYGEVESRWLVRGWGLQKRIDGDLVGALKLYRQVEAGAPDMGPLYQTIGDAEFMRGHDEAALTAWTKAARLLPNDREVDPAVRADYAANERFYVAFIRRDLAGARRGFVERSGMVEPGDKARVFVWAHEPHAAEVLLADVDWPAGDDVEGRFYRASLYQAAAAIAIERGDAAAALRSLDLARERLSPTRWSRTPDVVDGRLRVSALLMLGRAAEARAVADALPRDCHDCLIASGDAAQAVGDRQAADRWYDEAARQAPSLPQAHEAWGRARLARGDRAGAIEAFREAGRRSPNWADPLKGWGDALAGQGDHKAALKKYAAAAERAPRWGALQLAWGRSLAALGRRDEAVARWRAARGMDLTPADRAAVERMLKG